MQKQFFTHLALVAWAFLPQFLLAQNTKYGMSALANNTTGLENSAFGHQSLRFNTTGYANTAIGDESMRNNTDGNSNTALGYWALHDNTIGSGNVALGNALSKNTTGNSNIGIGGWALNNNTTGLGNVAVGSNSLWYNQSGHYNTAVGLNSLSGTYTLNSASENCSFGYGSLFTNTANYNNAFGSKSMANNKTGTVNCAFGNNSLNQNIDGSYNCAYGNNSLQSNKSNFNSAFGYAAGNKTTTGTGNSVMGYIALHNNVTGNNNTAIGYFSLLHAKQSDNVGLGSFAGLDSDNSTGCTYVGYHSNNDFYTATYTNSTALGFNSRISASNQISIGNSSVTSIGGFANWTNFSDGRYKKEVKDNVPGLAFITQLRPVTYHLDVAGLVQHLNEDKLIDRETGKNISEVSEATQKARIEKAAETETGFIAQEVEAVAKKLGYDFSGIDKPKNDSDLYGLRYAAFTVPLVKAVQELDTENKAIKQENAILKSQYELLLKRVEALELGNKDRSAVKEEDRGELKQNTPNPFSNKTTIEVNVASSTLNTRLIITDDKGAFVKELNLPRAGRMALTLDASGMPAGVYFYSLYQDGQRVETKKMVLIN